MKALIKLTAASILALCAIAPAFAAEEDILLVRSAVIVKIQPMHQTSVHKHRAADAYASAGAVTGYPYDFSIESQR
jgi:hypothetical protein